MDKVKIELTLAEVDIIIEALRNRGYTTKITDYKKTLLDLSDKLEAKQNDD